MASENLIQRVSDDISLAHKTSPAARCGNKILTILKGSPSRPYAEAVQEAVATVAQKYDYCNTTQELLAERFNELNN